MLLNELKNYDHLYLNEKVWPTVDFHNWDAQNFEPLPVEQKTELLFSLAHYPRRSSYGIGCNGI